jgi:membrane-associated phospholipid phosphatase
MVRLLDMDIANFIKNNRQLVIRLSFALCVFLVASIGFAMLADEVRDGETLRQDEAILQMIHAQANQSLDSFFTIYTELGGVVAVAAATLFIVGYLYLKGFKYKALLLVFAMGGAGAANYILKFIFERARPDLWTHLVEETSFSFPSGHAMGSSAFAFGIVAILWNTKWRILALVGATAYIVSIGFSRLYLGVHYPTDIVAGWLLSLVWVVFVASLVYVRMYHKKKSITSKSTDK